MPRVLGMNSSGSSRRRRRRSATTNNNRGISTPFQQNNSTQATSLMMQNRNSTSNVNGNTINRQEQIDDIMEFSDNDEQQIDNNPAVITAQPTLSQEDTNNTQNNSVANPTDVLLLAIQNSNSIDWNVVIPSLLTSISTTNSTNAATKQQQKIPIRVRLATSHSNSTSTNQTTQDVYKYETTPNSSKLTTIFPPPVPLNGTSTTAVSTTISNYTQYIVEELFINNREDTFQQQDEEHQALALFNNILPNMNKYNNVIVSYYGKRMNRRMKKLIKSIIDKSSNTQDVNNSSTTSTAARKPKCEIHFTLAEQLTQGSDRLELVGDHLAYEILNEMYISNGCEVLDLILMANVTYPSTSSHTTLQQQSMNVDQPVDNRKAPPEQLIQATATAMVNILLGATNKKKRKTVYDELEHSDISVASSSHQRSPKRIKTGEQNPVAAKTSNHPNGIPTALGKAWDDQKKSHPVVDDTKKKKNGKKTAAGATNNDDKEKCDDKVEPMEVEHPQEDNDLSSKGVVDLTENDNSSSDDDDDSSSSGSGSSSSSNEEEEEDTKADKTNESTQDAVEQSGNSDEEEGETDMDIDNNEEEEKEVVGTSTNNNRTNSVDSNVISSTTGGSTTNASEEGGSSNTVPNEVNKKATNNEEGVEKDESSSESSSSDSDDSEDENGKQQKKETVVQRKSSSGNNNLRQQTLDVYPKKPRPETTRLLPSNSKTSAASRPAQKDESSSGNIGSKDEDETQKPAVEAQSSASSEPKQSTDKKAALQAAIQSAVSNANGKVDPILFNTALAAGYSKFFILGQVEDTLKRKPSPAKPLPSTKAKPCTNTRASMDTIATQESEMVPKELFEEMGNKNTNQHIRGDDIKSSPTPAAKTEETNDDKKEIKQDDSSTSSGSSSSSSSSSEVSKDLLASSQENTQAAELPTDIIIEEQSNGEDNNKDEDDKKTAQVYPLTQKSRNSSDESSSSSSDSSDSEDDSKPEAKDKKEVKVADAPKPTPETPTINGSEGSSSSSSSSSGSDDSSDSDSSSSSSDDDDDDDEKVEEPKQVRTESPDAVLSNSIPVVRPSAQGRGRRSYGRRRTPLVSASKRIVINTSTGEEKTGKFTR